MKREFHQILPKFKREFSKLNRLTQEIVKRVFTMESTSNEFNRKLVGRIFGKLALETFVESGKYPMFEAEKNVILKFVTFHLQISDQIDSNNNTRKKISQPNRAIREDIGFGNSQRGSAGKSDSAKTPIDCEQMPVFDKTHNQQFLQMNSISRLQTGFELNPQYQVDVNVFKMYKVKEKYVNHLLWLKEFYGASSNCFRSFENLIRNAYSIDENSEFSI